MKDGPLTISVLVGSTRIGSSNSMLADCLARLAPPDVALVRRRIDDMPFFDHALETSPPPSVVRFKEEMATSDAILFVTPEFNRSVPAVLKNAIDWGSRPYGQSCWTGKPGAIIGSSIGTLGTVAAQQHLRNILSPLQVYLMTQPEGYINYRPGLYDENGDAAEDSYRDFLANYLSKVIAWTRSLA